MTMPKMTTLLVNHPYGLAHDSDVFKTDFRSKAAAEAYFTSLGDAGTLTFYGTEGVDYEFDADNGFRTLTDSGGCRIILSDILSGDELKYLFYGGLTLNFQLLTDEWIEPAPAPTTPYDNAVTDMDGTDATTSGDHNTYLINFFQNNTQVCGTLRCYDDSTTYETKGRNKLMFYPNSNLSNPNVCSRPLSRSNKGTYLDVCVTFHDGVGNMWVDQMTAVPPHGATNTSFAGERRTRRNSVNQVQYNQTTGEMYMFIGRYSAVSGSGCQRWIRNIRLLKTRIDSSFNPMTARIISFGDSYSATTLGPGPLSATDTSMGDSGSPGQYSTVDHANFADVHATLRLHQLLTQAGYGVGGMYGAGQGGYFLSNLAGNSLNTAGFMDTFVNAYYPSMVFTFGFHNDVNQVRLGNITVANFKQELVDNYLLPIMQRGCYGWGIVIPACPKAMYDLDAGVAWDAVADMLLALPAEWDAGSVTAGTASYPGQVKVIDARTEMGQDWASNKMWRTYYVSTEETHPSQYGNQLFAEKCADMALEWLNEAR